MTGNRKSLQWIQVLRGVASLLVVLLHISVIFSETFGRPFLWDIFLFGGSGVDIFFVLSGFIITYTNLRNLGHPSASGDFVKRRFVRIFPIYWIIITGLIIVRLLLPALYKTGVSFDPAGLLSTYLLLPDHFMVNGVSWSLTNELFFYLLFLIGFLIPSKKVCLFLLCAYGAALVILGLTGYSFEGGNSITRLLLFPMNTEFFLGVIVALVFSRLNTFQARAILITGILLFVTGAVLYNMNIVLTGTPFNRVLLFGVPSFFLILGVVALENRKTFVIHNIFLSLGDASYSIYLFHLPVVAAFYKILARLHITNLPVIYLLSGVLLFIIAIGGILIYNKIEKPLIRVLNEKLVGK